MKSASHNDAGALIIKRQERNQFYTLLPGNKLNRNYIMVNQIAKRENNSQIELSGTFK